MRLKTFNQSKFKDVIENIRDGVRMDDDYYDYDRNDFIKMLNKMDGERLELVYPRISKP